MYTIGHAGGSATIATNDYCFLPRGYAAA